MKARLQETQTIVADQISQSVISADRRRPDIAANLLEMFADPTGLRIAVISQSLRQTCGKSRAVCADEHCEQLLRAFVRKNAGRLNLMTGALPGGHAEQSLAGAGHDIGGRIWRDLRRIIAAH